ncbi:terpene cyclase/mutase family protein [Alkaliphilus sp. B6464]|uniref:terpene cyclase/mutase family protein n=1 Tax=Alkaliphilus sp. B6464 TaxID=2731219 RepID=UPI001BAACB5C|nr:terpene cyclase/mutase family protein [Alkaliphilus sp. B6464]QUH21313.1 terpene cyclase/mutase family protein [Alkaliphilus sp. B6464]
MLSKDHLKEISKSIIEYGRPLEKSLFKKYFYDGSEQEIINELKKFQNVDGGFGHGLESDFRLPYSSPMATLVGIRHLSKLDKSEEAKEMIKEAIRYLESCFDKNRNGWFAVPKEVNNFSHAPWWHYNEEYEMSIIDENWGNPSAEILAYLYKYREYLKKLDVDSLIEYAIDYMENKEEFYSENEIFCYIKLYGVLPNKLQKRLKNKIQAAIEQLIEYEDEKWIEYVPTPVDFVSSPDMCKFEIKESKIIDNLDFIIKQLESNGRINPPWGESFYMEDLKPAYNEWIGVLTLNALTILDKYSKVEK